MTLSPPTDAPWDPLDPRHETEPTAEHARLRGECPVAHSDRWGGFWTLSRYADITAAARDVDTFISGKKTTIPDTTGPTRAPRPPLESDPPIHGEYRTMLNRYFAPRRIRALEPAIRRIARELIGAAIARGDVDAVEAITYPMPAQVLCTFMGIPTEDGAKIKAMANEVLDAAHAEDQQAHTAANDRIYAYIDALVAQRRAAPQDPEEDVVSGLLEEEIDGRRLTDDEASSVLRLILQAGHGTTSNAIGSTFRYLAEHPDEQRRLRENPTMIPAAIEEILRMWTPARLLARTAARDVEVHGQEIKEGEKVALMWSSANRDPEQFDDADVCIIDRRPNRHVAFGHGIHSCIGAPIARAEIRIAVEELFALTEHVTLAGEVGLAGWPHIGPKTLPLRFIPRRSPAPYTSAASRGSVPELTLGIETIETIADNVVEITLTTSTGEDLPSWQPGAHLELALANGLSRQYSLCGEVDDPTRWRVAVLREQDGRGGSAYLHDQIRPGDTLPVRGPRNNFRLGEAPRYVFLASGIGITPLLPMIAAARAQGAEWTLHYVGRTRESMSYLDRLAADTENVTTYITSEAGRPAIAEMLGSPRDGTLIYACGSQGFLLDAEKAAADWPAGALHIEWFAPKPGAGQPGEGALESFQVELERSGVTISVVPGQSIIDAAGDAGVTIPGSCFEGTCGSCESVVLDGTPDHRDSVLSAEDRAAGSLMLPCVSRSRTPRLVLDV